MVQRRMLLVGRQVSLWAVLSCGVALFWGGSPAGAEPPSGKKPSHPVVAPQPKPPGDKPAPNGSRVNSGAAVDPDHARKMARGMQLFKSTVRPLLVNHCLECHGGETVESEFDLSTRKGLLRGGSRGAAVLLDQPDKSLLLQVVNHQREPHMPEGDDQLPAKARKALALWISLGAPYDRPLREGGPVQVHWSQKRIRPEDRQHWSWLPLRRPPLPPVGSPGWCQTPVDRFILARLEQADLKPNPAQDQRRLVRRLYLTTLGVPPTPEEMQAYLNDHRPGRWRRLVDRVLADPRYGERWARHWLDLARFAESHGFEHDYDRPYAYFYRDFVIQALNRDMPYDQFVRWQIAGDELAPDDPLAMMATGFLAAGVHSTQITKKEAEKHRYDEMDDMLGTIGTAMLGLTIGCARCHDHKYDPIPMGDYYRMLSVFTTTVRSEPELILNPEEYRKQRTAFEAQHRPFEEALRRYEQEELPEAFRRWEQSSGAKELPYRWIVSRPLRLATARGATLKALGDGTVVASGKNPKQEVYTVELPVEGQLVALRLEALHDAKLPKGGPGRAPNGNFALSHLELFWSKPAPEGKPRPWQPLALKSAQATFEQKGLAVKNAIDADPRSAWAVDPQVGKDHAAVFTLKEVLQAPAGSVLRVVMHFRNNTRHALGRFRLAYTDKPLPGREKPFGGGEISWRELRALRTSAARRDPEQKKLALGWFARHVDPRWQELERRRAEHLKKAPRPKKSKVLVCTEGLPPVRLHSQGKEFYEKTYYLRRGDPEQKEGEATPDYMQVLTTAPEGKDHWHQDPPPGWRTSYRRRNFAMWLTDPQYGAGHLLARVIVNRLWHYHFGRGIVATPSDFGRQGLPPSHPQLLDYLASELIASGWSLKHVHRLILNSATYRQSSLYDPQKGAKDPENRLWWRWSPYRLEAEAVRDSLLAVAGVLDRRMYGPGTLDEGHRRRSIYFTVKRSKLVPMMVLFDAPDALQGIGARPRTTIAPQALLLMNNPHVRSWAGAFARSLKLSSPEELPGAVDRAYRRALCRPASAEEQKQAVTFIRQQAEDYRRAGHQDALQAALRDFCQTLFCLNEFVYVD